jgi:hypothetical protein
MTTNLQMGTQPPRILCFGAHPFPKPGFTVDNYFRARLLFKLVGGNLGNCIIGEYATRGISGSFTNVTHFPGHYPFSPEETNERFDHVLVVAANWFTNNWMPDFSKDVEWFGKLRIPVTVIGLGQQLPSSATSSEDRKRFAKSIPESFVRLLRVWLDHGPSISVRGETTRELLSCVGIRNAVSTGCPTWFVNGSKQPDVVANGILSADARIAVHGSNRSAGRLFRIAKNFPHTTYVIQSELPFLPFSGLNPPSLRGLPGPFLRSSGLSPSVVGVHNPAFLHFGRLEEWEAFLRTCSFSFGERIHGTICAIKNGVPAVIVRHDRRISEFVDLFKIPAVEPSVLDDPGFSLESAFAAADFSGMNREYPTLLAEYRSFLHSHGLEPSERNGIAPESGFVPPDCPFDGKRAMLFEWKCGFDRLRKKAGIRSR